MPAFYLLLPSPRRIVRCQHCHFSGFPGATYNRGLARRSGANEVVRGVRHCGWWEGLSASQWRGYVCDQWSMMGDHPAQRALRPGIATPTTPTPRSKSWPSYPPTIRKKKKNKKTLSHSKVNRKRALVITSSRAVLSNIKIIEKCNLKTQWQAQYCVVNIFFCSFKFHPF